MADIIEHAAHGSLNEVRSEELGLVKLSIYDRNQQLVSEHDCKAVALLQNEEHKPKGYKIVRLPAGGYLLGAFSDGERVHFSRMEYEGTPRVAILGHSES
jgi:hypothetical protein